MISKLSKFRRIIKWGLVAVSIIATILAFVNLGWVQAFGWIYSVAFALSAIPEAITSIKKGRVGISDGTLICWIIGEIAGIAYGIGLSQLPLIFNCGVNAIFVGIIVWYRLFPKDKS